MGAVCALQGSAADVELLGARDAVDAERRVEFVYLLWHSYELHGCEEVTLIGVYAHSTDALEAQHRVEQKPGFNERRHGFEIVAYQIGKDHWTEGFVTL